MCVYAAASLIAVSWGSAAGIVLSLDAPSLATGTGSALYLDGEDAAAVRATVVDANGAADVSILAFLSPHACVFLMRRHPRPRLLRQHHVLGCLGPWYGMGDGQWRPREPGTQTQRLSRRYCLAPHPPRPVDKQEPNAAPSRLAYHGLARGIVRVSAVTGGRAGAALLAMLNPDAGASPQSARILRGGPGDAAVPIVVQASSPGLPSATISISTSEDPRDSVMSVAAASVGLAYIGE